MAIAETKPLSGHLHEGGPGAIADLDFTLPGDNPGNPVITTGFKAARAKPFTTAQKQGNKSIAAQRAACKHPFTR